MAGTKAIEELLEALEKAKIIEGEKGNTGFLAELFLGNAAFHLLEPFPEQSEEDKALADPWLEGFNQFLWEMVDPNKIHRTKKIPDEVIEGLKSMRTFGLKILKDFDGLEFSQSNNTRTMISLGSWCSNVSSLVTAATSLGVAIPLLKVGTEEQKRKFLPRFAAGDITAFALTEEEAGTDPSRMETCAERVYDEKNCVVGYEITGEKLYTTGLIRKDGMVLANYVALCAKIKADKHGRKGYGLFIVPTNARGFKAGFQCHFSGFRGIINGVSYYRSVFIPRENLIGNEGDGFAHVEECLHVARLGLVALSIGGIKQTLQKARYWCNQRKQWLKKIGRHELVGKMLVNIAWKTFVAEALVKYCSMLVDTGKDFKIESAAAKWFVTEWLSESLDDLMQIRAGRGYETYGSQKARYIKRGKGEIAISVERQWRDARVHEIFEGTNEAMFLIVSKACTTKFLNLYLTLRNHKASFVSRMCALGALIGYFLKSLQSSFAFSHRQFICKEARVLSRHTLCAGMWYQASLMSKQIVLDGFVRRGINLMCMSLALSYCKVYKDKPMAYELTDYFCDVTREEVLKKEQRFLSIFFGHHRKVSDLAEKIMAGEARWLEEGILSELKKEGVDI